MGFYRRGDLPAGRGEALPAAVMDPGWLNTHRICDMTDMHDHFYKVLWQLLKRLDRARGPAMADDDEADERGTSPGSPRKGGYALTFAGCEAGDGASTMAFNFASAFSMRDSGRVILVDGNFRDPGLQHLFRAGPLGLCDLVRGRAAMDEAVTEVVPEKYYFVRPGQTPENPMALYGSEGFSYVMEALRSTCDLLIFDSPPLMDAPEAAMLASKTDGLVMVLQAERTRWEMARAIQGELSNIGVPILGAVLNKGRDVIPESISKRLWPYRTPFWRG